MRLIDRLASEAERSDFQFAEIGWRNFEISGECERKGKIEQKLEEEKKKTEEDDEDSLEERKSMKEKNERNRMKEGRKAAQSHPPSLIYFKSLKLFIQLFIMK